MDRPFLEQLDATARARLIARLVPSDVADGRPLLKQGQSGGALRTLLAGSARVERSEPGAAKGIILTYLVPGDVFGEISFLDGATASASVIAEGDGCRFGTLPPPDLAALLSEDPSLAAAIYRSLATTLAARLRETSARVGRDALHPPPQQGAAPGDPIPIAGGGEPDPAPFRQRLLELSERFRRARSSAGSSTDDLDELPAALTAFMRWAAHSGALAPPGDEALFRELFPALVESPTVAGILMAPGVGRSRADRFSLLLDEAPGGETPLQRTMDSWILDLPTARAARAANAVIRNAIHQSAGRAGVSDSLPAFRVARIGATSRCEILDVLRSSETPPQAIRATLIDGSSKALMAVASELELAPFASSVSFVKAAPLEEGAGAGTRLPPHDAIVVHGAAESATDARLVEGIRWIRDQLKPGGTLYLSHLATHEGDRAIFEHLLDWPLSERSPEAIVGLLAEGGFRREAITLLDAGTEVAPVIAARA
ncbi:hypothetical protein BH23VER1_BH23VER1_11250 [soil metagenome]